MAWTDSHIFPSFFEDAFDRDAAFDLDLDAWKLTIWGDTITPDHTVAAALAAYNAGVWASGEEFDGTEWDQGGEPLTNMTVTHAGGVLTIDADNVVSGGANATLSAYGDMVYDDDVADRAFFFRYYGGVQTITGGQFEVQQASNGLVRLPL